MDSIQPQTVTRYTRLLPWNPASSDQVLEYVRSKGYKVYKARKPSTDGTRHDTADEDALRKTIAQHPEDPVLPGVLQARAIQKALGFLGEKNIARDGAFHPQFLNTPDTGRLAAKSPNTMQIPRGRDRAKKELAKAVRAIVVPRPSFTLLEVDWSSIEPLLVGYFARDEEYQRMARLGIHAIFTAMVLGQPVDLTQKDAIIRGKLRAIKAADPDMYDAAKTITNGRAYLRGIDAIAQELEVTYQESKRLCGLFDKLAPGLRRWQQEVTARAHQERKLTCPLGCVSPYYFNVRERLEDGTLGGYGKQAYEACSWPPQHTGSDILKLTLIELAKLQGDNLHLLTPIHDAFLMEVRTEALGDYKPQVRAIMERPLDWLGGLRVGCEMKAGPSWAEMEEVV